MKNFFVLLLKGIGIALAVSLAVCFFAWNWGNWRVITWTVIGCLVVWQICKYLCADEWVNPLEDDAGNTVSDGHFVSTSDKVTSILAGAFIVCALASVLWIVGFFGEWIFNWPSKIFEYTILKGILFSIGIGFCCVLISALYHGIKELGLKFFISGIPEMLKWILIIGISCSAAAAVFYYCFPY
ncbi:MAG: hypothetical protein IJ532_01090 [Alphaproteobacteria bacterium]|nr:hypothetical protein [Alphaproteobacteria bacterium]